jgi:hypothetical protein
VDLLQFGDEFQGVAEVASKSKNHQQVNNNHFLLFIVDTNELQRTLNEIKARVTSAQTDLDNAKNTPADSASEDRFTQAMEVIELSM